MCQLCSDFRPWDVTCPYRTPETTGGEETGVAPQSSSLPVYSYDQIADQLTSGYWSGATYAFELGIERTLTVDLAGLTQAGQEMARLALDAWTDTTGILFQEAVPSAATAVESETTDAGNGTTTLYSLTLGEDFQGSLDSVGDRDSVAVTLAAGDRITIEVVGDDRNGAAANDVTLRLLSSSGIELQRSDDPYGPDGTIAYEITSGGTYYVETGGAEGQATGDYSVSVRSIRTTSDITFDDDFSGAFAQFWTQGGTITRSAVNIDDNWAGGQSRVDGYFYQTYLHEIGHALGLGHAGNYNGSASYPTDADYLNDSWQASVMSYFYQTENTFIDASFAYVITPQVADLIAIQSLYGTAETRGGDSIYGNGGNNGGYLDTVDELANPVTYTVIDTGGTDVFDFSHHSDDQFLDLREERFSDIGGLTGNVGIARGTVIEYGKTGGGDDVLIGNEVGNGLTSGTGSDTLDGGVGNDALASGDGIDLVQGGDGFDLLVGGNGDDSLNGGEGGDLVFGDGVTLDDLTALFPGWTPPPDAEDLFDDGDLLALWDDIVDEVFAIV